MFRGPLRYILVIDQCMFGCLLRSKRVRYYYFSFVAYILTQSLKSQVARGAVFYIVLYVKAILNKILFKPTEQPKKDNTMVLKLRLRSTCRPYWWNCCQASCPPEASLTRSTWACPSNIYWLWPARPSTFSSTAPWAPSTAPLCEPCAVVGKSRIPTQDTPVIQGL